ncbi:ubiquitin carboxyl-terminal hydrolase [Cercophora newfieldiana]|uniref:Ubiquitin carboxyl-terminal hydrolase n=1 Tax=Cercophora newfieldiana TaxID=92897 RepID=A0AA40D0F1_9PEZI|nr:ubiquitin carboxyl-terminal hydrolase [Cercophora newfieldiana]
MAKKTFVVLENHPEVMKALASKLGISPSLTFHDIYSLDLADLSYIPKPVVALLAIIPPTPAWGRDRQCEDAAGLGLDYHDPSSPKSKSPIIWFKQTIGHACGSIGLLHSVLNGPASEYILPGSLAEKIRDAAAPLGMDARAQMLYDSQEFEEAHMACAHLGDTVAPEATSEVPTGHFVAFVKVDGRLWELEGSRQGPIDRGELGDDEDLLSPRALELGLKRIITLEKEDGVGDIYFSCLALVGEEKA